MANTQQNLMTAFAGESMANRRYLFCAEKAERDGYPRIARLFRAAADAETVHARSHFLAASGVGATKENLEAAIQGEHYEFTQMYPEFMKQAEKDGDKQALTTLSFANAVEKVHHNLFQKALEVLSKNQTLRDEPYFVCQGCGYTVAGEAPDKCPICGAPKSRFKKVD